MKCVEYDVKQPQAKLIEVWFCDRQSIDMLYIKVRGQVFLIFTEYEEIICVDEDIRNAICFALRCNGFFQDLYMELCLDEVIHFQELVEQIAETVVEYLKKNNLIDH